MELIKKRIQTNVIGKTITDQFVIDDDYNVPDSKSDVGRVIVGEGTVKVEEVKKVENYLRVVGKLFFKILYVTDASVSELASLQGQLPYEEMVYLDKEDGEEYIVQVTGVEFHATVIHSRKLSLKAMVDLSIHAERTGEEEITMDVEGEEQIFKKIQSAELLKLHTSKKDIYRMKEEVTIPGTKENIGTLIWTDVELRKIDTKVSQDVILFTGTLQFFALYKSEEDKTDWVEQTVPFEGSITCNGAEEGHYHHMYYNLSDINVEVRMDGDGEMRALGIEATLEMRVLLYEEEQIELLEDVYSLAHECILERQPASYEELITQNHSKYKFSERLTLPELKDEILQICHSGGRMQIEHMDVVENGIQIEGVLYVNFLYVKANDGIPFGMWSGMLPFSYVVESGRDYPEIRYNITANVEQLSIDMAGSEEVEVKAVLAFQSFLRLPLQTETIVQMELQPFDEEEMDKRPGIIGYITKEGDDLWSLAKRYYTTEEGIMENNQLTSRELRSGEKLLIFKENMSIL